MTIKLKEISILREEFNGYGFTEILEVLGVPKDEIESVKQVTLFVDGFQTDRDEGEAVENEEKEEEEESETNNELKGLFAVFVAKEGNPSRLDSFMEGARVVEEIFATRYDILRGVTDGAIKHLRSAVEGLYVEHAESCEDVECAISKEYEKMSEFLKDYEEVIHG